MTSICCVTVTYGDRKNLLKQTISGSLAAGIENIIVVNNGASWNVADDIRNEFDKHTTVVNIDHNSGSAHGFRKGLETALLLNAEYILLLDDDTAPAPGTIDRLMSSHQSLACKYGLDNTIVVGYREAAMRRTIASEGSAYASSADPPMLRFSPRRALGRFIAHTLNASEPLGRSTDSTLIRAPFAPFGGILIHRSVLAKIGFPDERFVLYCDDFEWTHRILAHRGIICIDTEAPLREIELSVQFRKNSLTRFHSLVLRDGGPSDYRIYYEVRNSVYFATHTSRAPSRRSLWRVRLLYIATGIISVIHRRRERFKVIRHAISDGLTGKLGLNHDFPLEQNLLMKSTPKE